MKNASATKRWTAFLSLFFSLSTLLCCALPAFLVSLGLGAAVAGVLANFPQLVWLSEHKAALFAVTASLLLLSGLMRWKYRQAVCAGALIQKEVCEQSKDFSRWIYWCAVILTLLGFAFAYGSRWFF